MRCKEEIALERKRHGKKVESEKKQEAETKEEIEVWVDEVIEQIEEEVIE